MRRPLLLLWLLLLVSIAASGQSLVEEPTDRDEPCFWEDDVCFDYQQPAGYAPGMVTCTTNIGCKACVVPDGQMRFTCATDPEHSGACRCEMKPDCKTEGSCTYRR